MTIHKSSVKRAKGITLANKRIKENASKTVVDRKKPAGASRFLHLPPELRNRIYGMARDPSNRGTLPQVQIDHVSSGRAVARRGRFVESSGLISMVRTCKQVHREASGILYGNAVFFFNKLTGAQQWMKDIGTMRSLIRHVVIATRGFGTHDRRLRLLKDFTSLQKLEIYPICFTRVDSRTIARGLIPLMTALAENRPSGADRSEILDVVRFVPYRDTREAARKEAEVRAQLKALLGID